MNHYVYEITNLINGKKYIGKRSCKCKIEDDKYMGSGKLLKKAFEKYGKENFRKDVLFICESEEHAYAKEWIEILKIRTLKNWDDYYNIAYGGKGGMLGITQTEERRRKISEYMSKRWKDKNFKQYVSQKISESKKGHKNPMYGLKGEKNHNFGKQLTKEHRNKISRANKGKYKNEKNWNSVKVIRMNDLTIFNSITEAKELSNQKSEANIVECCNGKRNYAGKINGKPAKWMYYSDYLKLSDKQKTVIGNNINNIKLNNCEGRKIICLATNEVFGCIKDAGMKYGIPHANIIKVCKNERNYAGKINGEPARWMYYEDYLKINHKSNIEGNK